jgi:hypothetical protein
MAVHAPALFYELPVRSFPSAARAADQRQQRSAAERLKASPREGRTLEDVLSGAWEDLTAHRTATCPICDGAMAPRYGSGPSAVGGRCVSCRSELH